MLTVPVRARLARTRHLAPWQVLWLRCGLVVTTVGSSAMPGCVRIVGCTVYFAASNHRRLFGQMSTMLAGLKKQLRTQGWCPFLVGFVVCTSKRPATVRRGFHMFEQALACRIRSCVIAKDLTWILVCVRNVYGFSPLWSGNCCFGQTKPSAPRRN